LRQNRSVARGEKANGGLDDIEGSARSRSY
jgi:hypothetical protein